MALKDLDLSIVLRLVDRVTDPVKRITGVTGHMTERIRHTQQALRGLHQAGRQIERLDRLQARLGTTGQQIDAAKHKLGALWRRFNEAEAAGKSTRRLTQQIATAQRQIEQLGARHAQLKGRIGTTRSALREAGHDTRNLARAKAALAQRIEAVTARLVRQQHRLKLVGKGLHGLQAAGQKLKGLALWGGLPTVATGGIVGGALLNTAKEFERYQSILTTLEGSQKKAKVSMDWVSDFAVKTPFEVGEVTEAFVKLRAYGLDPTNGLLRTLGDTGAAMGKPILQAVEAIADAVTGENERLKEFGIKARQTQDEITYQYTDRGGIQKALTVAKDDREAIEAALVRIWDEKYTGAMERMSQGFTGLWSNLMDQVTRFQKMVMDSGPFERLKERLGEILTRIDAMAASGELQAWAERVGGRIVQLIDALTGAARGAWTLDSRIAAAAQKVADFVGGWEHLVAVLLAAKFASVVGAIGAVGTALASLATLATGHPVIALVAVIAGAAGVIIAHWESVSRALDPVFRTLEGMAESVKLRWDGLVDRASGLADRFQAIGRALLDGLRRGIDNAWEGLKARIQEIVGWLPDWVKQKLGIHSPSRVFAGIGANLMQGLVLGLAGQEGPLMAQVERIGARLKQAGKGLTLAATLSAPATATQPPSQVIQPPPPLRAQPAPAQTERRERALALAAAATPGPPLTVHVHAAPGMDERRLADLVGRKLQEAERTRVQRQRARLFDDD
jgi:phage tail tape-measure protein